MHTYNLECIRAQHSALPDCVGQAKLKVGHVNYGSHMTIGKIPLQRLQCLFIFSDFNGSWQVFLKDGR